MGAGGSRFDTPSPPETRTASFQSDLIDIEAACGASMSNVVYLPKVDLAKAPAPAGDRGRKPAPRFLERVLERVRVGLRRALAYADLLGRQQREIAALQARVERLERICERALPGQDGA